MVCRQEANTHMSRCHWPRPAEFSGYDASAVRYQIRNGNASLNRLRSENLLTKFAQSLLRERNKGIAVQI